MPDDEKITYFAETDSRNRQIRFGIKAKDRTRHMYVIGKTGMGKSTVLDNLAIQDIQNGNGLAFIDPHGSSAEKLLEYVPEHRIHDVLYFAPFDMEYPVSFNVMEDVGPDKRHLVVNGLMSAFKKIWVDAWSARMEYILSNTLLALLEYPGSTLLSINKMLADKNFRKKVVDNIQDPAVRSFWVDEFAKYTERFAQEATPAIQNKVGQFTSNPLIRNIIGQTHSTFDIRKMMDDKKIIIINLSKGRVGEGNANLLGSMLITKIYLAAMSRADTGIQDLKKLPNFYLFVDEFQSFANESFADILSEARKYKLNLTIAHQYIEQMVDEVRSAVFGNVGTMISFRVGAYDAEVLEKEFAPQFTAEDIVNLGQYQMYLRLMIDGVGSSPFSARGLPPLPQQPKTFVKEIIEASRKNFTRPRAEVEKTIRELHDTPQPTGQQKANSVAKNSQKENNSYQNSQKPKNIPTIQSSLTVQKNDSNKEELLQNNQVHSQNSSLPLAPKNIDTPPVQKDEEKTTIQQPFKKAFEAIALEVAEIKNKEIKAHADSLSPQLEVHLDDLKEKNTTHMPHKKKSASVESLNGLREALKTILPAESLDSKKNVAHSDESLATQSLSENHSQQKKSPLPIKEIPEDELKKILHVEATE